MTPDPTLTRLQSILVRYLRPDGGKPSANVFFVCPHCEANYMTQHAATCPDSDLPWPMMSNPLDPEDALGEIIAEMEAAGYGVFASKPVGDGGLND